MKKLATLFVFFFYYQNSFSQFNIIPQPASVKEAEGFFVIDNNTAIVTEGAVPAQIVSLLQRNIKNLSGLTLSTSKAFAKKIVLKKTPGLPAHKDAYKLYITPLSIQIEAGDYGGFYYAIQSTMQLLPAVRTNAALQAPCVQIEDAPRFSWRGMHLDVSRHFFTANAVKEYIDLMARYKLNTFHWHLCDDQGWRLEIKKYPKLTEVGAWRVDRNAYLWGSREPAKAGEKSTYGGYYTQEQVKEIVAYAAERNITIVPEIEMPGHSTAAIAAYPNLGVTGVQQAVVTGGQYPRGTQSNYDPSKEEVYTFLQNVLTEVMAIFPSTYIHIGGDEVDKADWKNSPAIQAFIKKQGLKNEEELQSYFIKRLEKFLVGKGRRLIGWDEILEGGLAPEATVMSWRGEDGGIKAAQMQHHVVMTPGSPLYFDHYQAGPDGEPAAFGGFNTLQKVYQYNPTPAVLSIKEQEYILGAQANLWTEMIQTREQMEYMVLPRMLALAEVVWTPIDKKDWNNFTGKLPYHYRYFENEGYRYCKGNYTVRITPVTRNNSIQVELSSEMPGVELYYTTDGSIPGVYSEKYKNAIPITKSQTIKAIAVENGRVMNAVPAQRSFSLTASTGSTITYKQPPSRHYMSSGNNALVDGLRGTAVDIHETWHGFNGTNIEAVIDLGKAMPIHKITIGCLQKYKDWIFLPQGVRFSISTDNVMFTNEITDNNNIPVQLGEPVIKEFSATYTGISARYIKVIAQAIPGCPPGHPGEGNPGWIFADEITIE